MLFQWTRDIIRETLELIDCPVWYVFNVLTPTPGSLSVLSLYFSLFPVSPTRARDTRT